ncbi:hypothetical protein DH2020_048764 [Rehmannia glutinosa]|uniref:C2 NT-type domain-containing protein n=1 Tax=Rehmannia glutinosa TaxID=99300 RepID=A0ABR0U4S0_REHGL
MVLGLKTKTRKSPSVQLDYIIHIQEINPWPPSHSLRTLRAVLIQWEHGNRASGLTNQVVPSLGAASGVGDGRIEFNESFRLPLTLVREVSTKGGDGDTFQKNCIEFNLYEQRRDKTIKGQLLGTAVLDLADYGMVKENLSVSAPINCKRTYRNTAQPLLFLKIQPVERSRTSPSLMREASMDRNRAESVSALMSEEYAEEAEVASFTTDDDDVSSYSSLAITSTAADHVPDQLVAKLGEEQATESHGNSTGNSSLSTEESFADHSSFSSIDRSKHGKSFQSLVDSSRHIGSTRSNHFLGTDTARGSTSSEHKDAKAYKKETRRLLSDSRVQHLERRIKILEGELMEAAAIEFSLYSVVAEHGSSMSKVHTPARRLSRLYFQANKHNSKSRRGTAAKNVVSGLVLVAKACGNDVPRLTFWLSNSIVLRVIVDKSFGDSQLPVFIANDVEKVCDKHGKKKSSPLKQDSFPSKSSKGVLEDNLSDWENPLVFAAALERVEAWIFSRIIESLWWQSGAAKAIRRSMASDSSKLYRRTSSSIDQQGNFSVELWKNAFGDACERICPARAGGHDCGCLPVLSKLMMEQLIARLDVAMINAILRESADEIPTDPVADPISDAKVLPIPAGKASFGAGALLKNAVCPSFGLPLITRILNTFIPDEFCPDPIPGVVFEALKSEGMFCMESGAIAMTSLLQDPNKRVTAGSTLEHKYFKDISDGGTPGPMGVAFGKGTFGTPRIGHALNFGRSSALTIGRENLSNMDPFNSEEDSIMSFPCAAAPVVYQTPSAALIATILGQIGSHSKLTRSGSSVLKKSQTSDDELDELGSPLKAIIRDSVRSSPSSIKPGWISKENGSRNPVRYQLLQEVWVNSE